MKKRLLKWHLYLALSAGLFIFIQSISGALLTFGKEIQRTVSPHSWKIEPQQQPANTQWLISQLESQAQQENLTLEKLYLESNTSLAWQASISNGEQWNVNPYTGEVVDRFQSGSDFYSFTVYLHRWLLFNNEPERSWARHLTSIAASILIIQTLIGLTLWLKPRKTALKRLKLKKHKTLKGTLIQWHLILGVYTAPLLISIVLCGIGFNWPVIGKLVEWSTVSKIERPAQHQIVTIGGMDQWPASLLNGQKTLPQGQLHRIYFPKQPDQPMTLRYKMPEQLHPFSYVWLDGGTGKVLGTHDARTASAATQVWNFKYKFHIGDFAGWPIRLVWLILSLLPGFFVVSGVWLWWQKRKLARSRRIAEQFKFISIQKTL